MAESNGLLNRRRRDLTAGSNPALSAIFLPKLAKNGGMKPSGFASWHAMPLHASQDALHILRHRRKMLHKKRLTMKQLHFILL